MSDRARRFSGFIWKSFLYMEKFSGFYMEDKRRYSLEQLGRGEYWKVILEDRSANHQK